MRAVPGDVPPRLADPHRHGADVPALRERPHLGGHRTRAPVRELDTSSQSQQAARPRGAHDVCEGSDGLAPREDLRRG